MILYPSIHLKDGVVARLTRGDISHAEVLHKYPGERAAQFEAQGFAWLHVVDLDGAFEGKPTNTETIKAILKSVKIPVQVSGGLRDLKSIEAYLGDGVSRIVMSSVALHNPDLVREACKLFPGHIAVKIDSRTGSVLATGWAKTTGMKALDVALRFEDCGVAAIIYADINRDGALSEVNVEAIIDLAFAITTPVIASGGVNTILDLKELKSHAKAGIAGLILGRALYDGKILASEALALAAGHEAATIGKRGTEE